MGVLQVIERKGKIGKRTEEINNMSLEQTPCTAIIPAIIQQLYYPPQQSHYFNENVTADITPGRGQMTH